MPTDANDLAQRLALCKPTDRVRGIMFNEVLRVVSADVPAEDAAKVRAVLPADARFRDVVSYPIADFLKLMYAAVDALESKCGGVEPAFRVCGGATVNGFAKTTAGSLFFGVIAKAGPTQLLRGAGAGYASVVTYGKRTFESTGDSTGVMRMTDDMLPLAYHEGVFEAVLRAIGFDGVVRGTADGPTSAHYEMSWSKPKPS